jgi:hypothetical protein
MSVLGYSNGMLPTYFSAANKFEKERQEEENIDILFETRRRTQCDPLTLCSTKPFPWKCNTPEHINF